MDKDTKLSAYSQLFEPFFHQEITKKFESLEADKYVKKLTTIQLIQLIAYAQIQQQDCLREISNNFHNPDFQINIGLESISFSQISRRLRDLEPETVKLLFRHALQEIIIRVGIKNANQELGQLHLIDSSTISLCLTQYPWAVFRKTKSGIKLHLRLKFWDGYFLPDEAIITNAKVADRRKMDELLVEDGDAMNIFDRGYVDYKKFDQYCEKGVRFTTRLKENAIVEVIEEYPVNHNSPILKDQRICLGNNHTKMTNSVRLIEVLDTKGERIVIITNDFELKAEAIGNIYRYRWQIELFFKWLKQHFSVKHFYGTSQPAVENQLYIALCSYCLLMLIKLETGFSKRLLELSRILSVCFFENFTVFIEKLRRFRKKSHGRRKMNHEIIYKMTEWQVLETLEAGHLNDLTYDPIVL
jgi:Transposase DDE domain/Domain of unknown function (DUF4372)